VPPQQQQRQARLSPAALGAVAALGIALLPFVFLTTAPFVWLLAIAFDFGEAFAVVSVGTAAGMAGQYALARTWLAAPCRRLLARWRGAQALLLAVQAGGALRVVFLNRLGPLPYPVLNYVAAVPHNIRFGPYFLASLAGVAPQNAIGVWFGRQLKGISAILKGEDVPASQLAYNLVSIGASAIIIVAGYFYARAALRRMSAELEARGGDGDGGGAGGGDTGADPRGQPQEEGGRAHVQNTGP
jgi:uncharacterized membrane protein YdjX (TVP38/TMEM64 family)